MGFVALLLALTVAACASGGGSGGDMPGMGEDDMMLRAVDSLTTR
jgi:hypothetical protein